MKNSYIYKVKIKSYIYKGGLYTPSTLINTLITLNNRQSIQMKPSK